MKYLDPKNDLTFKRVFGEHKNLCISLLNSMLPLDENQQIESIEYQTGELTPMIDKQKNSIVDVRCTDIMGRQFIVEMQMYWSDSFTSRVLFNASKVYVNQLDKSKDYKMLKPVYALNFVNEIFEKSPKMRDQYYHHYKIVNIKDTEKQIKGLEFVFIELPKFKPENRAEKKLHELWLRYLTEIDQSTEQVSEELLENQDINEALKYVEMGAYTKEQLFTYDKVLDSVMVEISVLSDAKEKGMAEGMEKGRAEGKAEGKAEGEYNKSVKIAKNLLKNDVSISDIQKFTGLSEEDITNSIETF